MRRTDLIERIDAPKYKLMNFVFNEYEIRGILAKVSEGDLKEMVGKTIIDSKGIHSVILDNGRLSKNLHGFDITSKFTMRVLKARNK